MKKLSLTIIVGALLAPAIADAQPEPINERGKPRSSVKLDGPIEGVGVVQYDPGAPADSFLGQTGSIIDIGNRFNSRNGQPLSPGSISGLSFYVTGNTYGNALVDLWTVTTGGLAFQFGSIGIGTVVNGTFNAATFSPLNLGIDFLAGLYLPSGGAGAGQIGLRSASTNNQGFHAMQISFSSPNVSTPIPGNNAMFRVTGSIVVPVELMEFDLD